MEIAATTDDTHWIWSAALKCSLDETMPSAEVTQRAKSEAATFKQWSPAMARNGFEAMLLGRGVHVALQWLHEAGVLAVWLPEIEATVDF